MADSGKDCIIILTSKKEYTMFPQHGYIACNTCFTNGQSEQTCGQWKLDNNPCAWGGESPSVLVLGFSKGANQTETLLKGKFEDIAFSGMRDRLKQVLVIAGLLDEGRDVNMLFSPEEKSFAFGSLLRCGLGYDQTNSGRFSTSGPIIAKSFKDEPARTWINNCSRRYLADLPKSVEVVILLGVANAYIENCWELVSKLYSDTHRINKVAYQAGSKLFVHVAHPSPANGTFNQWHHEKEGAASVKRELALEALNLNLTTVVAAVKTTVDKVPEPTVPVTSINSRVKSISYRVSRGKLAGETLCPIRNKNGKYVVSKTRFSRDQIYIDSLEQVLTKLQSGYKVRVGGPGSPSSLVNLESLEVVETA